MEDHKKNIRSIASNLLGAPASPVWWYEGKVANELCLKATPTKPQRQVVTEVISAIRSGYAGAKANGITTGWDAADLHNEDNGTNVRVVKHGKAISFDGGTLVETKGSSQPRYFAFGDPLFTIKDQIDIAKAIVGQDSSLPDTAVARRKSNWRKWYQGETDDGGYGRFDVPAIAQKFSYCWEQQGHVFCVVAPPVAGANINRRSFQAEDIALVEKHLRMIVVAFSLASSRYRSDLPALFGETDDNGVAEEVDVESIEEECDSGMRTPRRRRSKYHQSSTGAGNGTGTPYPDALRWLTLSCRSENGKIDWDKAGELASLEHMFHLMDGQDLVSSAIPEEMEKAGVDMPDTISVEDIMLLSGYQRSKASQLINRARSDLLLSMGAQFQPRDDEMLHQWLRDGRSYSDGRRIEDTCYEMNPDNRQMSLTTRAAYILRHIMFTHSLPISTVISLWVCFYTLIMGRPIPKEYFSSMSTVWAHILKLAKIDDDLASKKFREFITTPSKHGFRRYFYQASDDSEHHGVNRHVLLVSDNAGKGEDVDPSFRHLTSSQSISKDSEGNSDKNLYFIEDKLGLESAAYFGGGTADNASDAQKEIRETFTKIQAKISENGELANLQYVNGVRRRPITFGDLYHVDNLIMQHCSNKSWGDVLKDDHQQIHHRQLLQSIHSLHTADPSMSQEIMNEVMEDSGKEPSSYKLKTNRERQQRWLVNQRNAKRILAFLEITNIAGIPCIIAWAMAFCNWCRSEWQRRVGGEIALWASMPSIVLGLHYEAELGEYFERTYYWHNRTGPFNTRPGFRMMEVHDLYFGFMLPYWNEIVEDPASKLPKTMKYLDDNFEGEEKEMRRAQIMRGLRAGREELIKMTQKIGLLDGPVAFLILCNKDNGPAFLRALLAVIDGQACPVEVIRDRDSDAWGKFQHDDPSERPADEKIWYDQLMKCPEDALHWWRQFCLDWDNVADDLQRLSKEAEPRACNRNISPLAAFRTEYPVLHDCLHAVFGMMMSNSRLCEQVHGMMRQSLRAGTGMDEADAHRTFTTGIDYLMKAERRQLVTSSQEKAAKRTRAEEHSSTKTQLQMLSKQLFSRASEYSRLVASMALSDQVESVKAIITKGRRQQDKDLVAKKMESERSKRAGLTRETLTIEKVRRDASITALANDKILLLGDNIITRRSRLLEMKVLKFWRDMKTPQEYRDLFSVAVLAFPYLGKMIRKPPKKLTSRQAVMDYAIRPYIYKASNFASLTYEYLYGVKKEGKQVPKRDRLWDLMDVFHIFVKPVERAWDGEAVAPASLALMASFKSIGDHYKEEQTDQEDDDVDLDNADDNYGQIMQEVEG